MPCGRPLQLVPKLLFPFPVCVTVEEALTSGGTEATFGLQVLELVQCDFFFFNKSPGLPYSVSATAKGLIGNPERMTCTRVGIVFNCPVSPCIPGDPLVFGTQRVPRKHLWKEMRK